MMASCSKFELLLAQKLDDALLPEAESLLEAHLLTCVDCRKLSEELLYLQQTLSSLSTPPPPSLHTRIMEEINAEAPALLRQPAPVVRPMAFSRRFATTAAALVLLVSALAFGTKLMPNAPTEGTPSEDAMLIALPDPQIEEAALPNEAAAPQAKSVPQTKASPQTKAAPQTKSANPDLPVESIQDGSNLEAKQAAGNSASEQLSDTAPPDLEDFSSDTQFGQPSSFLAARSLSSELTQEEAEALLRNYLADEGTPTALLTFDSISSDGVFYQFFYTDAAGTTWKYTVSLCDGSISCASAQDDHLSAID